MVGGGRLEMNILFLSRTDDRIEFHSIPFHSIPFQSIPFHVLPNAAYGSIQLPKSTIYRKALLLVKPRKRWTDDRLGQPVTGLVSMLCLMRLVQGT